jgi:hypothetical protein
MSAPALLSTPALSIPPVQLTLPRPVAPPRFRQPKKNIPQTPEERNSLMLSVRAYVERERPVPPLPTEQLREHADKLVADLGLNPLYRDYTGVLINNELWRESLAAVPFERRLLLIPKCLRLESKCRFCYAEMSLRILCDNICRSSKH